MPLPLIDIVYVDILFGKSKTQTVPRSIRAAQNLSTDCLAVPKAIYTEYCSRLTLNTVFEKLTRVNSTVYDWWARVETYGDMCDKSILAMYTKFVDQGGESVEKMAESVENSFRLKGEEFRPSKKVIDIICSQVKNDMGRYKRAQSARVNLVRSRVSEDERDMVWNGENAIVALEEARVEQATRVENSGVMFGVDNIASVYYSRPESGGGRSDCFNCRGSGHLAYQCSQNCTRHRDQGPRVSCSLCKAEYRKRVEQKYGGDRGRRGFGPVAVGAAVTPPSQQAIVGPGGSSGLFQDQAEGSGNQLR